VFTIKQTENTRAKITEERKRDHAWFIAFAPVDDPKIALSVLVENGGFGASAAAPIARKVLDAYMLGPDAAGGSGTPAGPAAGTAPAVGAGPPADPAGASPGAPAPRANPTAEPKAPAVSEPVGPKHGG
jgi:penicillin-binding protein 2